MLIKELRQKRLLSQEQLAELCGLSLRTIQRVESGHRIGFASLRALATEFDINVESLEQELSAMEKLSNEYKDLPLWLRLYFGSSWYSVSRKGYQRGEILFVFASFCWFAFWCLNKFLNLAEIPSIVTLFISVSLLASAYVVSISIRLGDTYDIWSRLEATQPKSIFGFGSRKT